MHPRATTLINELELRPHPEGGHYRELFRSTTMIDPGDGRAPRAALTGIYFLLARGQSSAWHRVASDEVWHIYEGDALELLIAPPDLSRVDRIRLDGIRPGSDGPQHVVPAGWWQAARALGDYTLAGCNVAPGFDFADFTFLRDDAALAKVLQAREPDLAALL
jgi:predicted cupin superfamily sugar epimerase